MNGFSTMYKGQKLYFSEGQCNYLRTIQRYRNLGDQAAERYGAMHANCQKFSILANKGIELDYQLIDEYLTSAVKGAAKGIALAGAVNGVSGLFHSGANTIGNTISRVA